MDNMEKTLKLLGSVATKTNLLAYADRIELKRQRSGHYRLYVACIANTPNDGAAGTDEVGTAHGFSANPYKKGGYLTSVSFADNDEPQGRK